MDQIELFNHLLFLKPFNWANTIISVRVQYLKPLNYVRTIIVKLNDKYYIAMLQKYLTVFK